MKELNTYFYDEYKGLDKLCRDMFSSQDGVTEYIKQMENISYSRYYVPTWDEDYKQLKRMRHLRNKLAHEVGFDEDLCTESDIIFVKNFHTRLLNLSDPISIIQRQKEEERKRQKEQQKAKMQQSPEEHPEAFIYYPKKKKSILDKIYEFFRKHF